MHVAFINNASHSKLENQVGQVGKSVYPNLLPKNPVQDFLPIIHIAFKDIPF